MSQTVADLIVVRADRNDAYDLGPGHPLLPAARELSIELAEAAGILDGPRVRQVVAEPADDAAVIRVHAPAYVAAVKRYAANPIMAATPEAAIWGLGPGGDTPAFAGMHAAAAAVCGASIEAARAVWEGDAKRSFAPQGGLHHAFANRAAGFCIYNDPAVAIAWLLDHGAERVAYVDIDVHHGDGVQWIFYEDPRVLTCSVHESGQTLFPGTGGLGERGVGPGAGLSVNIPLPAFAGTVPYLRAIEEVIVPAVTAFHPDVLVTQNGVDPHHQDPLAHLNVEMAAFPRLWEILAGLADTAAGGRWVALGGGGYNPDVLPRAYAMLAAEMAGAAVPEHLPTGWLTKAEAFFGRPLTDRFLGDEPIETAVDTRTAADQRASESIAQAKSLNGLT